jgi:hypothetical protein
MGIPIVTPYEFGPRVQSLWELTDELGDSRVSLEDIVLAPEQWHIVTSQLSHEHMATIQALWLLSLDCLVATRDGRLGQVEAGCALCPPEAGDEVWILFGCTFPVILRPRPSKTGRNKQYSLIGSAYIPVLMRGEACTGLGPHGAPEEGYDGPLPETIDLI